MGERAGQTRAEIAPTAAAGPSPAHLTAARRRHRRRVRVAVWLVTGLTAAIVGGVSAVYASPAWTASLAARVPAAFVIPGTLPRLPWPASGEAAVAVAGLGRLGDSGPVGKQVPIASVAKVLTAYQILTDHPLRPGASGPTLTVTRAEAALYWRQVAQGQSLVAVKSGERLTERQALQALLLASADNVAQILARWDAGSVNAFIARLNKTAKRLGMTHSRYTDPSGLDSGTVSTANDQLRLASVAMGVPAFAELVSERTATIPVAGRITNYNQLLGQDGVVGIKTGSMHAAGGCLMFAADVPVGPEVPVGASVPVGAGDAAGHAATTRRVYGVVLGQPGTSTTILPHALAAAKELVEAVAPVFRTATVVAAGEPVATVHAAMRADRALAARSAVTVEGWPGLRFSLHVSGTPDHAALTVQDLSEPSYRIVSALR